MAKKRKKNKAQQPLYMHPQGYMMGQGMPWPGYGYPPAAEAPQAPQQMTGASPEPVPPMGNAYGYGMAQPDSMGAGFGQQGQVPQGDLLGMGLLGQAQATAPNPNMANDPAAAYLKAAGLDTSLLQGLPNALRSRHTEQFLLGLLIGGAAAWVLSDEELRNKLLKTGLKLYSGLMGGLEELKEQVADVRAELDSEQHGGV